MLYIAIGLNVNTYLTSNKYLDNMNQTQSQFIFIWTIFVWHTVYIN